MIKDVIIDKEYNNYTISDYIEIKSEYRCFVFKEKLLDCRCYSGDFTILPDFNIIQKMIKEYKNIAYTLDVGINEKNETIVIECHDFFSCGLYGFDDYSHLIKMIINTHTKIFSKFKK